jgi:hypothetical protein
VVALLLIFPWNENYGHEESDSSKPSNKDDDNNKSDVSFLHSIQQTLKMIRRHPEILFLGLSQAFFEGAMYTFGKSFLRFLLNISPFQFFRIVVFMWVPALILANGGNAIPTGLVFSAFMLSMTLGGILSSLLLPIFPKQSEGMSIFIYGVSALSMLIPMYSFQFSSILFAFLVLEAMVGMFNSCSGLLRSQYYPEGIQSSIMSLFRFPLNLLVVLGTTLANQSTNSQESLLFVFKVIVGMFVVATILQIGLVMVGKRKTKPEVDKKKKN